MNVAALIIGVWGFAGGSTLSSKVGRVAAVVEFAILFADGGDVVDIAVDGAVELGTVVGTVVGETKAAMAGAAASVTTVVGVGTGQSVGAATSPVFDVLK